MGLSEDIKQRIADDCIAAQKARLDHEAAKVLHASGFYDMPMVVPEEIVVMENNVGIEPGTHIRPGQVLYFKIREGAEMFPDISDPLISPLPPTVTGWDAKERRVEWVRRNFSKGELAMLYKLSYDVDGLKRAACDAVIAKEKKG